ncbi:hypothetical protein BS47DRAFT_1448568 [Hydnum rufescens UP504]|uniref:THUMP domain-containing protein n=1 Tax=Hydnum rufescens UP504 TaxID=1448309 RepID=A0A9P6B0A2_9AGAM|nr:hypothetical protein BS47DRAFT_1448568 [Hydnum rufescens UP504]
MGSERSRKKNIKKYMRTKRPASKIPHRNKVEGPGIWVSCVKGKEKQTVGELYDLFESLADVLYPPSEMKDGVDGEGDQDEDLETAMAKEIAELNKPRNEHRFVNCRINAPCTIFFAVKPPIDPVRLVSAHIDEVNRTGITHTKFVHVFRFSPVWDTCAATLPDIVRLAERLLPPAFDSDPPRPFKYRIQLSTRNHNALAREELYPALAKCVPIDRGHSVDIEHAELVILVELYMFVCGLSVVRDYDRFRKFNVNSIAEAAVARGLGDEADGSGLGLNR